ERGEFGGHRVGELFELGLIAALQQLDVVAEVVDPQRAQASRQAPVNELALRLRQRAPGDLAPQLPYRVDLRPRELEFDTQQSCRLCTRCLGHVVLPRAACRAPRLSASPRAP